MVLFLLPLFWAGVASLRPIGLPPLTTIEWWPQSPKWQNYLTIFEVAPFAQYTLNSVLVLLAAIPLTLLTASLAGFGMAHLPQPWRGYLVAWSIALLLIPDASVWLFRFQIFRWLGFLDSLLALILPAFMGSSALFVLLFYWNFRHIPLEIYEAARLEGATAWLLWWRLALPLSKATTVGVTVLAFVLYWSDFIGPVLYIFDPQRYTLPVGLQILKQLEDSNWPLLMAAAVLITLPVIVLFVTLQRFFLHEISLANLVERG